MKKVLAIVLSLVLAFSLAAIPVAAEEEAPVITEDLEELASPEGIAGIVELVKQLYDILHMVVGDILSLVNEKCPFCDELHVIEPYNPDAEEDVPEDVEPEEPAPVVHEATPENLADILAVAQAGEIVSLGAGDYEVITLGVHNGITIEAEEGAVVDYIATTAETDVDDVTLKGFALEVAAAGEYGLLIDANAAIDNLVLEDCTFTGPGNVKNCYGARGNNVNASLAFKNCTFKDVGYAIWSPAGGGFADLTFDGCNFINIYSWVILVQYGYTGNLTINGCTFAECEDGISKNGTFSEGKTFTFTNNTVGDDCAGHDGSDAKWFTLNVSAGTAVVSGNTLAGAEWIPGAAQGLVS